MLRRSPRCANVSPRSHGFRRVAHGFRRVAHGFRREDRRGDRLGAALSATTERLEHTEQVLAVAQRRIEAIETSAACALPQARGGWQNTPSVWRGVVN